MSMPHPLPGMSIEQWIELNAHLAEQEKEEAKMLCEYVQKQKKNKAK